MDNKEELRVHYIGFQDLKDLDMWLRDEGHHQEIYNPLH